MQVNTDKTKTMVFKPGNTQDNTIFYYNDRVLENDSSFTNLGATLTRNGKFFQAQKSLSKQASRALFSLNKLL